MHTKEPRIPGIIIAGKGSNTGKTTTTLALLCALAARGMPVCAAKTGPDYIDTAFHAAITGLPAANLDTWMCRETPPKAGESPLTSKKRLPKGLRSVFAHMAGPENAPNMPSARTPPPCLWLKGPWACTMAVTTARAAPRNWRPCLTCPLCWYAAPQALVSP